MNHAHHTFSTPYQSFVKNLEAKNTVEKQLKSINALAKLSPSLSMPQGLRQVSFRQASQSAIA